MEQPRDPLPVATNGRKAPRTLAETGRYNLHVLLTEDEHVILKTLVERSGKPQADFIRQMLASAGVMYGVSPARLPEERRRGRRRRRPAPDGMTPTTPLARCASPSPSTSNAAAPA